MVWFQCEDCGENLKKPKLPNHFRICSGNKLSCIDCGETFGQQSVQAHNQCISEAEKYGPKGQGKASYGTQAKTNNEAKQKPDIDINVGLSSRPPWFCSLCNTNATSKQTLLLHAEGKKHRAKARAFHAAKQQSVQTDGSTPNTKASTEDCQQRVVVGNKDMEEPKQQEAEKSKQKEPPKKAVLHNNSETENGNLSSKKKRKLSTSDSECARKKDTSNYSGDVSNGEVIQAKRAQVEELNCATKKSNLIDMHNEDNIDKSVSAEQNINKKIKWKKLIATTLKSNADGVLKMKKLQKLVVKALLESGVTEDETQLKDMLVHKINSSSRFTVEGKFVFLVGKN